MEVTRARWGEAVASARLAGRPRRAKADTGAARMAGGAGWRPPTSSEARPDVADATGTRARCAHGTGTRGGRSGAERLVLVRGDEREAAPVKGGREGGGGPHVRVETRGAARLEVAVVEEDGDDRRRRGGDPARTLPARGVPSDGDGIRGRRGGVRRGWCRGGRASRRRGLREEARPRWWGGAGEGAGVGARGGAVTRVGGASAPDPHRIVGWGRGDRAGGGGSGRSGG